MIHSHINYCLNVYSCANTTNLQRLRVKQKEAIRVISNAGYRDHTQPLFKKEKILPLDEMIKYSKLRFMHSFTHHNLPFSFEQLWMLNRDINQNRILRNANNLQIPTHHYASIKRLPLFSFPHAWNTDCERKFIPSLKVYSKQLKMALLATITA
jgi:hypothetical protein